MKNKEPLGFMEWYDKNHEEIDIELAENGADREMCFDMENEYDIRYDKYCESFYDESPVDLIEQENELTRKLFDLEKIIKFQQEHDVQVIRGGDFQYLCYINKEGYAPSLTPLHAVVVGIEQYNNSEQYSI